MIWAVVGSGESLAQAQVDYIRQAKADGKIKGIIAISNVGLTFLPDADALVSHDGKWWACHPEAINFKGDKYCRFVRGGIKHFVPSVSQGCNSGFMAMEVAWKVYKATKIILLGIDMKGSHFFGLHQGSLKNSTAADFQRHKNQFNSWRGCEVINCSPDSALTKFPLKDLREVV